MAEDVGTTGPGSGNAGQSAQSPEGIQATQAEPNISSGQSVDNTGTTGTGSQGTEQDIYYDPREYERLVEGLPAEVKQQAEALRKSLQSGFTKKTQALKGSQQKIQAYDAFMANPQAEIIRMAQQLGLNVTGKDGNPVGQNMPQDLKNWQPQTWEEVMTVAEQRAYERIRTEQQPIIQEVENLRKSNLEKFLDENAPDWREFEAEMMETLTTNPSLITDPLKLYRASVPIERIEGRAYQQAIKKLQSKSQSSQVAGQSTTTQRPLDMPKEVKSFDDAYRIAKAKLQAQGIVAP